MNKFIDEKGRIFGKISIIDIIVIILAIILVCAVFVRTSQNKSASEKETINKITYVMKIGNIKPDTANAVLPGDKIYAQESGVCMGVIKETEVTESRKAAQTLDGTYVDGYVQGRNDLKMIIESDCRVVDGRYYSERTAEISVNAEKDVQTKYVQFTGRIMEIL